MISGTRPCGSATITTTKATPDHQLPDERQIAAQVRRAHVEDAACRSPGRSACRARPAPPRSPARCRRRSRRTPARPPSARRRRHSRQSPRTTAQTIISRIFTRDDVDAEVLAALLVLADRHQDAPGVAAHEQPARPRSARPGTRPRSRTSVSMATSKLSKPDRPLLEPVKVPPEYRIWLTTIGSTSVTTERVERRGAVVEREPARPAPPPPSRRRRRRPSASSGVAGAEAEMGEDQARRIGADAEERRLAEGEDAGVAPQHVDRERDRRIEEGPDQDVDHVGRQHVGADRDQQQRDDATIRASQTGAARRRGDPRGDRASWPSATAEAACQPRLKPLQPRRSLAAATRRTRAASTTMVRPPRIGLPQELTSTCAPPSTRHAIARLSERHAGDHHQHEGVDQPGHAHVGIDARQRRDQRAGEAGEPGAQREGDEAHQRRC